MNSKDTLTRNYIFEAYYELLKKQAYQDINVCDICTKAGVSRMSFYRNFKSKDDLTQKAIERIISNLKQSLKKCEPLNQFNVTKEIFTAALKYKDAFKSLDQTNIVKDFINCVSEKIFSFTPEDKINPSKQYIPIFYFSAISGVLGFWIHNGAKETPEEMAKGICSIASFPIFDELNLDCLDKIKH